MHSLSSAGWVLFADCARLRLPNGGTSADKQIPFWRGDYYSYDNMMTPISGGHYIDASLTNGAALARNNLLAEIFEVHDIVAAVATALVVALTRGARIRAVRSAEGSLGLWQCNLDNHGVEQ
jgi:hypothetical protein